MSNLFSSLRSDARRHGGITDAGTLALLYARLNGKAPEEVPRGLRTLWRMSRGGLRRYLKTVWHLEIHGTLGEDVDILHGTNIMIHPNARVGSRVGIMHDVVVGTGGRGDEAPIIEDDVFIGVGAKILGGIRVGKGATIGSGSVVVSDVPEGATVMGVPARVMGGPGRRRPAPDLKAVGSS